MPTTARIYFDFIDNLYCYLFICALVKNTLQLDIKKHTHVLLLTLEFLYAIPETIPYQGIVSAVFFFFTISVLCYPHLKKAPLLFIKSELFIIIGQFFIQFFYTLITFDFNVALQNPYYDYCKSTICTALVYIVYVLYINGKRMNQLRTHYHHMFTVVIISISLALSYLTLFICQIQELKTPVIPILFSALFILIIACIEIYKQFIVILEENMQMQIQLEKSKLTAEYSRQIDKRLKELHSLRHDMRNHFLTIDGYASQKRSDSLRQYISQISEKL